VAVLGNLAGDLATVADCVWCRSCQALHFEVAPVGFVARAEKRRIRHQTFLHLDQSRENWALKSHGVTGASLAAARPAGHYQLDSEVAHSEMTGSGLKGFDLENSALLDSGLEDSGELGGVVALDLEVVDLEVADLEAADLEAEGQLVLGRTVCLAGLDVGAVDDLGRMVMAVFVLS